MQALRRNLDMMRAIAVAATALAVLPPSAAAEPLSPDVCETLRRDLAELESGPAAANAARGPEWGKANLSPDEIKLVARLISLRESVLFRCRRMLVETDTPPAAIDPDKIPLPERNRVFEAAATANPPGPPPSSIGATTAGIPAPTVQPASATTSAVPPPPPPPERPR